MFLDIFAVSYPNVLKPALFRVKYIFSSLTIRTQTITMRFKMISDSEPLLNYPLNDSNLLSFFLIKSA